MKLLTRAEEFVLLAVWRLQNEAYSIPIRKQISEITGRNWSLGAIYMPLERLVKKDYLGSHLSDSTPERGGKTQADLPADERGQESPDPDS